MRSLFCSLPAHPPSTGSAAAAPDCRSKALALPTLTQPTQPTQPRLAKAARGSQRLTPKHKTGLTAASPSSSSDVDVAMARRGRPKRDASTAPSLSNPTETTGPVRVPSRDLRRGQSTQRGKPARNARPIDPLPPSLAALLAVTDIPRPKRRPRSPDPLLVADHVQNQIQEGKLSLLARGGPLDLLLSPPEDVFDQAAGCVESTVHCFLARTTSADSIPSLGGDSFTSDTLSSLDTPASVASSSPRRRPSPVRRSLEPVYSPPDSADEHPLAADVVAAANLDADLGAFDADDERPSDGKPEPLPTPASKPLRSVFRSNLTASLRALRSAARSFASANQPAVPADALLSRSVLAIDPKVPYADERRPPVTEEMPSAELRRYLNPTSCSLIDPQPPSSRAYSASIQMQTYKVQRSRPSHPSSRSSAPMPLRAGSPALVPGMRQREMRENSDFIRIAVMEMAMRKHGKLDSNKPGRARWALPPRRPPIKAYEIGPNGVPARWAPMTC